MKEKDLYSKFKSLAEQRPLRPASSLIIVGFSGGADSVCLLDLLFRLSRERGDFSLAAHHQHHMIRGESADRDLAFCRDFCEARGIPFYFNRDNVPELAESEGLSLEEAGRLCRQRSWKALRDKFEARGIRTFVATAHHADDRAETLLLRLERGSGLWGMGGILPRDGFMLRPLLSFSRAEIEAYLASRDLPFCRDESNEDLHFRRNFLRRRVLPLWQSAADPGLSSRLAAAAALLAESAAYMRLQAAECLPSITLYPEEVYWEAERDYYDPEAFSALPEALKVPVLKLIRERKGFPKDWGERHFKAITELLAEKGGSKSLDLPGGVTLRKNSRLFYFAEDSETEREDSAGEDLALVSEPLRLRDGLCHYQRGGAGLFLLEIPEEKAAFALELSSLSELELRSRRPGDYFVSPEGHKRPLKKVFSEEALPADRRREFWLLCRGSEVVWSPGGPLGRHKHYQTVKISEKKGKNAVCFKLIWYNSRNK